MQLNTITKKVKYIYIPIAAQTASKSTETINIISDEIKITPESEEEIINEDENYLLDDENIASSEDIENELGAINENEEEISTSDEIDELLSESNTDL